MEILAVAKAILFIMGLLFWFGVALLVLEATFTSHSLRVFVGNAVVLLFFIGIIFIRPEWMAAHFCATPLVGGSILLYALAKIFLLDTSWRVPPRWWKVFVILTLFVLVCLKPPFDIAVHRPGIAAAWFIDLFVIILFIEAYLTDKRIDPETIKP